MIESFPYNEIIKEKKEKKEVKPIVVSKARNLWELM
jgi:hypothetical protein